MRAGCACLEHSNLFKVNVPVTQDTQRRAPRDGRRDGSGAGSETARGGPPVRHRDPTTSFLTATTLIYAIGAGITAAAGTRLALQSLLVKGFELYSFQLQDFCQDLYCYLLSLPPCVRIG